MPIRLPLILIILLFMTGCALLPTRDASPDKTSTQKAERTLSTGSKERNATNDVKIDSNSDKPAPRKAEQDLSDGIKEYQNGNYVAAKKNIGNALIVGLSLKSDQISAHKYLAFIYCVSERKKLCEEEFKHILVLDPKFELSATEAGHPSWGPVFRNMKKKQQSVKKS